MAIKDPERIKAKDWHCPGCDTKAGPSSKQCKDGGSILCETDGCNVCWYHWCALTGRYETVSPMHTIPMKHGVPLNYMPKTMKQYKLFVEGWRLLSINSFCDEYYEAWKSWILRQNFSFIKENDNPVAVINKVRIHCEKVLTMAGIAFRGQPEIIASLVKEQFMPPKDRLWSAEEPTPSEACPAITSTKGHFWEFDSSREQSQEFAHYRCKSCGGGQSEMRCRGEANKKTPGYIAREKRMKSGPHVRGTSKRQKK